MLPFVMAIIDTNRDGVISTPEQSVYAERVLAGLSLAVNGDRLELWLISTNFPEIDTMKEGLGEMRSTSLRTCAAVAQNASSCSITSPGARLQYIL